MPINIKRGLGLILEANREEELAAKANDPETVFCPCCGSMMWDCGANVRGETFWTCYDAHCEKTIPLLWPAFQKHMSGHGLYGEFYVQLLAGCIGETSTEFHAFCQLKRDHKNDKIYVTVYCEDKDKAASIIAIHTLGWTWMDWVPKKAIHVQE